MNVFRLKYKTHSSAEIRVPKKGYHVKYIKIFFMAVLVDEVSTLHFS